MIIQISSTLKISCWKCFFSYVYKSCLSGFVLLYLVVCLCFSMRSLVCLFMLLPSHSFPAGSFASVSQHVQGASHVGTQSTACYQSIHILKHASWIQWPLLWVTWFPWLPAKVWKKNPETSEYSWGRLKIHGKITKRSAGFYSKQDSVLLFD